MASGHVRLPDVVFVSVADFPGGQNPKEPIPLLPPTIASEVLSEGNTPAEMRRKRKEYFDSGARLVWIIDPATRTVAIYESFSDEPARILTERDVLNAG